MEFEMEEGKLPLVELEKLRKKQRDAFRRKYKTNNPNVFDPKAKRTVFEKILRTPKSVDDIKWSIRHGADLYRCNENKRYPIMAACDSLDVGNLEALLAHYNKSKINVKFDHKNCLHLLLGIFDNSAKRSEFKKVADCLKILLDAGCDPNSPDSDNRTPFFLLLRAKPKLDAVIYKELVDCFMKKSLDVHSFQSEEMMKMLSQQGLPIPAKFNPVVNAEYMRSLLDEGRNEDFIESFQEFKDLIESSENRNGYENATGSESEDTALFARKRNVHFTNSFTEHCAMLLGEAVKNGATSVVEFLLSQGVDINKFPDKAKPAAFLACSRGYHEILELLLNHTNEKGEYDLEVVFKNKNLLHEVCSHFGYSEEPGEDVNQDYQRCFDLLMSCPEIDFNQQDELGFTPLYYAVRYRNDEATKVLLRKCYVGKRNIFHKAQIYHIRKEIFEEFLDECVSLETDKLTGEQKIKVDFNFLVAPEENGREFFEEIAPLEDIANNTELRPLILHPVLSSFLYLKWIKLSILFYTNLLFFLFFMGSFITYIVLYKSDVLFALSLISLIVMMCKEIMQAFLSCKNYFKSHMNWFEMTLIVLIWIVLLDNQFKSVHDSLTEVIGMKTLRIIRAVTILCCSYEFLILFGDLPNFAVSTHMVILKRVFITFLKSIALYSILLVGFAFCFYTLFGYEHQDEDSKANTNVTTKEEDDEAFHNFRYPGFAIIKTIVMFSGELEASNLNLRNNDAFYSIIFLLFVFLVTIVLLNLINGLSVSDVFQIKAEGHLVDLCQKIHVLNKYERIIMSRSSSCRFLKSIVSIFPEFVQNGNIEIDTGSKVKLSSSPVPQESILEQFYHKALRQVIKFDSILKRARDPGNLDAEPQSQPGTFAIKLDSNIMKKVKSVIEERVDKRNKVDHHARIVNIEARLLVLSKMDEKLQKILNVLDENY